MTVDEYRCELINKLDRIEREIESYRATLTLLDYERRRLQYMLGDAGHRTVPRSET